jgi:Flp pilus assembly protein TadG
MTQSPPCSSQPIHPSPGDAVLRRESALPGELKAVRRLMVDSRGSELVEFALSVLILMFLMVGIMDFCRALYACHFVAWAAQSGARYAIVRGADWAGSCTATSTYSCNASAQNIQSYVQNLAPAGISRSAVAVTVTWPGKDESGSTAACGTPNSSNCLVNVTVSYSFSFVIPFMPRSGINFAATSTKPIQQ